MHRAVTLLVALMLLGAAPGHAQTAAERFAQYAPTPPLLRAFLYQMPKGGDLHNHLVGAAYAEAIIHAGADRCVDPTTAITSVPPCAAPLRIVGDALQDPALKRHLVDAWSMRSFVSSSGTSGHDQFFDTFGRFDAAARQGPLAAGVVARAGAQRMRYIELMITLQSPQLSVLAAKLPAWNGDPQATAAALMEAGLPALVEAARSQLDGIEQAMRQGMGCDTAQRQPGCGVTVRWLQQINRTAAPAEVFAASLLGMLISEADPRMVGLDFVAPEDDTVALSDYTRQMRMLDWLHPRHPGVHISLHAGELTMGMVPPKDLTFHVRQAIELGHAQRIGHGVDVMYEDDPFALLREMARRRITVEVNLTSNAQILGVSGNAHPFPVYLAAGVPVVLSTDDEGVERIDRTHELQRAVTTYGLGWDTLVGLERNTLEYAFVEGASLWADTAVWRRIPVCAGFPPTHEPTPGCAAFLAGSTKARLQWSLEQDLARFNKEAAAMRLRP